LILLISQLITVFVVVLYVVFICSCKSEEMISEKVVEDQNLDVIQELLSYISSLLPQKLNENFGTPLDKMDPPQSIDLHNQVVFEGEKIASLDFSNDTEKVQFSESECDSAAVPPLLSRQSSLIEEWFSDLSSSHPNDIPVDSSLEALLAITEWQDFKVEMPAPAEAQATENRLADPSVLHSADNIPAEETVALESLPVCSAVCKTEPVAVPENLREFSSQHAEGIAYSTCIYLLILTRVSLSCI